MTQDDIIQMALEAGYKTVYLADAPIGRSYQFLERFAALVVSYEREKLKNVAIFSKWYEELDKAVLAEREACAKIVETTHAQGLQSIREACAAAIRARSVK